MFALRIGKINERFAGLQIFARSTMDNLLQPRKTSFFSRLQKSYRV